VGEALKIYTADEIAGQLKTSYKTVLNLIQRGQLKSLPGIRHKRITEEEFRRYLGLENIQNNAALTSGLAMPMCSSPANPPVRPKGMETAMDKSLVSPTAKVVAPPVAQSSLRRQNEKGTSS
jgi:excisionase family DNA binding protein